MQQPPDKPSAPQMVSAPNGQGFEAVPYLTKFAQSLMKQRNQALDLLAQFEAQIELLTAMNEQQVRQMNQMRAAHEAEIAALNQRLQAQEGAAAQSRSPRSRADTASSDSAAQSNLLSPRVGAG